MLSMMLLVALGTILHAMAPELMADEIFVRRTVPFLGETDLDRVDEEKP